MARLPGVAQRREHSHEHHVERGVQAVRLRAVWARSLAWARRVGRHRGHAAVDAPRRSGLFPGQHSQERCRNDRLERSAQLSVNSELVPFEATPRNESHQARVASRWCHHWTLQWQFKEGKQNISKIYMYKICKTWKNVSFEIWI